MLSSNRLETCSWKPYRISDHSCLTVHISYMVSMSSRKRRAPIRRLLSSSRFVVDSIVVRYLVPYSMRRCSLSQEVERRPESRKLELNGYLTKPTTRLARYPLLLEAVLKHTPDGNPDKGALPKAVQLVREFLKAVNHETGKAENRFNLLQLDQQLIFRPGEQVVSCSIFVPLFILPRQYTGSSIERGRSRAHLQGRFEEARECTR